jgi:hypothetical protein
LSASAPFCSRRIDAVKRGRKIDKGESTTILQDVEFTSDFGKL